MDLDLLIDKAPNSFIIRCPMLRVIIFNDDEESARDALIECIEETFHLECPYDFQMYKETIEMPAKHVIKCLNQLLTEKEDNEEVLEPSSKKKDKIQKLNKDDLFEDITLISIGVNI